MTITHSANGAHAKHTTAQQDQFADVYLIDGDNPVLTKMPSAEGVSCALFKDSYAVVTHNNYSPEPYEVSIKTLDEDTIPLPEGYAATVAKFGDYVNNRSTNIEILSRKYGNNTNELAVNENWGRRQKSGLSIHRDNADAPALEHLATQLQEAGLQCLNETGSITHIPTHQDLIALLEKPFTPPAMAQLSARPPASLAQLP